MSILGRYRCSRGFGVHSPFAYSFINDVIGERYRYYAYDRLEKMPRGMYPRRMAKLVHRVAVKFHDSGLRFAGTPDTAMTEAVALAGSHISPQSHVTVVLDMTRWDDLTAGMTSGMTFRGRCIGIIVADPKLPLMHYHLIM